MHVLAAWFGKMVSLQMIDKLGEENGGLSAGP